MSSEEVVAGVKRGIDEEKLIGGKKKNGHKMNCACVICKNMAAKAKRHGYTDDELKKQERNKGNKKANGHRLNCHCPICKNMDKHKKSKKGKRGGNNYEDNEEKLLDTMILDEMDNNMNMIAGKKIKKYSKKRKSRKSKKTKKLNKSRKTRK
jgi:hypothetical protein